MNFPSPKPPVWSCKICQEVLKLVFIKRDNKFQEAISLPKILNLNPRSIYNKIIQLKTFIRERDIDIVLISESWERLDEPLSNAIDIEGFYTTLKYKIDDIF